MNSIKILLIALGISAKCLVLSADCATVIPNSELRTQLSTQFSKAEFIPDSLNFGPVILFDTKGMGFTLKNTGTDTIFIVSCVSTNPSEFTVAGPTNYFLFPDSSRGYSVTFSPQSHLPSHTGAIVFKFADSSTDTLYCIGLDHLPIHDTLSISRAYLVYADSDVVVSQMLASSLAGALDSVTFFTEYINFDPNVLEIINVSNGANTPASVWTINTHPTSPGVIPVIATSAGLALQGPGEILRLQFHVKKAIETFQISTVWDSGAVFDANPLEPIFATDTGLVRVIDTCTVKLTDSAKLTDGIEQNFPNPASGRTTINYNVGETGQPDLRDQQATIPVSILLYNALGNVVKTLVDAAMSAGRYEVETDVSGLRPGVYWYEFRTGTTRELKPLIVTK
jgi:hypothetical protein